MAKQHKTDDGLESINVGIVGHIDHGKTTLLERLTGVWASRHSEELKRGITIKLGYADVVIYEDKEGYNIKGNGKAVRHVSFVDAPGHEMLMATMLSGAAMIDAAILVVAANEGIKPQTREHLMALRSKGVKNLIVVQNKIDLVEKEQAQKSYNEITELLKGKFDGVPIIPISAQQNVNIESVFKEIVDVKIPERDLKSDPVFVVARSFDVNKPGNSPEDLKGAVLGGALIKGILKVGDEIEIKPGRKVKQGQEVVFEPLRTKVLSLFKGSNKINELTPGGSMGIETELDMSMAKGDVLGGNVVSHIGKLPNPTQQVKIDFKLFPEVFGLGGHIRVEDVKPSEVLMLSVCTSITGGNVKTVKDGVAEISLRIPVVAFKGDSIGIARNIAGHWRLIGHGEIL